MKITLTALVLASALPLAAQTTATKPAVHHTTTTTTAAHRPAVAGHCSVALPVMSVKIPALPVTAPKCPSIEYQLTYIDTKIGEGELATSKKFYTVHYTGYLSDGTKFDSSVDRGEPITFPYGAHRVITGWDTGFEGMHVGGKRRLFVPYELAYGEDGRPPIPAKALLIFDVELVAQSATPPPAPAQPAAPKSATPPAATAPASAAPAAKPTTSEPAPGAEPKTTPAPSPAGAPTSTPPSTPKQ